MSGSLAPAGTVRGGNERSESRPARGRETGRATIKKPPRRAALRLGQPRRQSPTPWRSGCTLHPGDRQFIGRCRSRGIEVSGDRAETKARPRRSPALLVWVKIVTGSDSQQSCADELCLVYLVPSLFGALITLVALSSGWLFALLCASVARSNGSSLRSSWFVKPADPDNLSGPVDESLKRSSP